MAMDAHMSSSHMHQHISAKAYEEAMLRKLIADFLAFRPALAAYVDGFRSFSALPSPLHFQALTAGGVTPASELLEFHLDALSPTIVPIVAPVPDPRTGTSPVAASSADAPLQIALFPSSFEGSAAGPIALVEGLNGCGSWSISGVVRLRNATRKPVSLRELSVSLDVILSGYLPGLLPKTSNAPTDTIRGFIHPFKMKVATVDPAVIASDIVIPPSQDIYGLFTFPFDSPMPPALDLLTSTMHPNKMQVLYELKVAASEQRGKLLSKLVSNEPASLICNLPVPLITPSIGQSLSPSLTGEGPVGTLGPVPFPWWFRLSHQYVTPGDEFIAQIVVQHPHIGTPLDMIARVEFILSEFVIHFENPAIDPFQPVRATSHVVTRVKLSKGRMNWRSKADGVSSPALAAQCPADARTIKTVIKVPPHASARRVPSVEKVDEKLKLMAFGMRENDCVNFDGRWGSVVVMHEIMCIITCKTGEMTRIAEGILPIAVGPAKAGVFAAAKVQPGIGLPDYDHGKSSKVPPSPRPSHKGEGLSIPSREPSPAPPPSLALDGSASNRPTDNSPPTYQ